MVGNSTEERRCPIGVAHITRTAAAVLCGLALAVGMLVAPSGAANAATEDGYAIARPTTPVKMTSKEITFAYPKTVAYTGGKILPASFDVFWKGRILLPGVDYTIKLGANKKAGKNKGTITVVGKGDFTGSKTVKFTIKKMSKAARLKIAKAEAKRLAKLWTKGAKTGKEKAQSILLHLYLNYKYQLKQSTQAYKTNHGNEAYGVLVDGAGACSGKTRAFALVAAAAGLQVKSYNLNKWKHQVNRVNTGTKAKPKWVYVDVASGIWGGSKNSDGFLVGGQFIDGNPATVSSKYGQTTLRRLTWPLAIAYHLA